MPAGSYYAIAVDYLPQGEWNNPETLERLKPSAQHFVLEDGEQKTLDLKMRRRAALTSARRRLPLPIVQQRRRLVVGLSSTGPWRRA